ncbi:MAG: YccF domain-containing protein [Deltaproteobacteria bacterium]|nr:YccF domain-containing protein [Nannocystaceae bacterium]
MTFLGNIIWLVFGGLLSGLAYMLVGVVLCLTVVGLPFGVQAFKIGIATLAPFGKQVVELPQANSTLRIVFNVLWLVFAGWEIALSHLVWAGVLALTVVGVPFAIQHIKLIPLALFPFGRDLR